MNDRVSEAVERARSGGAEKYHQKLAEQGKLFVRERLRLLFDDLDSFVEEGLLTQALAGDLPADGVVTGVGEVHGRFVAVMANDPTVKAGSWGPHTVEKIIRIIELARKRAIPIVYLVDSAGARIDRQVEMFPGRRGAGKIFYNQVQASGRIPQVCALLGPSAAGGAYIPAFCDVVFMHEKNASMYLGSPRMAEEVIGEKVTLEEMGGARMHCEVSGCGDLLVPDDKAAIEAVRAYLSYFPQSFAEEPMRDEARPPAFTAGSGPITAIFAVGSAMVASGSNPGPAIAYNPAPYALRTITENFGTVASLTAVMSFAPWRMMPCRSTALPIMKPGTSARKINGMLNASHSHTNRATLSDESTNSTPPLCMGWFATTPTGQPSSRPSPVITSRANRGLISKSESSSMIPFTSLRMSNAFDCASGTSPASEPAAAWLGGRDSTRVGCSAKFCGK